MRRLPLDFRDQYFGCEIELTGINRATAAQTLADLFGTRAEHSGGGYDAYRVKDLDGKEWKIVRDSSIHPECRRRSILIGETYKVELNSPKLEYGEMEKLQEVVRSLRRAGGIVNDSCGMHVHVDASKHTPQSLKNVLSIMYSKEDILFAALKVNPARIDSYCQAVDEPILEEIRKLPSGASMDQLKDRWYQGRDGSDYHYTLTEKRAPDGYTEAESIVFKLVQEGTEQVNEVYVKSDDDWAKLDNATIIMQDAPVLDIDKTDIASNLLPGATLTIRDAGGEVIDTWVTDYKTHRVPISDEFIKLSDDSKAYIYTLTEDSAPAGFEIANSVQFKLESVDDVISLFVRENADAEWTRAGKRLIQMIDEATPREDTPTATPAPTPQPTPAATPAPTPAPTPHKVQTLPQTGDGFPLLAIVVVSLASATGIVLLTVRQKNALKETSDEEDADESADR